jgi:hypothetical protein
LGSVVLKASHPKTLAHQTWIFPQDYYGAARVLQGKATIKMQDGMILVTAEEGRDLSVELALRGEPGRSQTQTVEARR